MVRLYDAKMTGPVALTGYFVCLRPKIVERVDPEVPMPKARQS